MLYEQLARYYDLTHNALVEDIDLILQLAKKANGSVLELGCGTGRLLRPLSQAGHDVTGVDNSAAMLALAQQYLEQEPLMIQQHVQLVEQDFTVLSLPNGAVFDLVIIPYNTFLHLDQQAKRATLKRLRRYLTKNGRLFIDIINPFILAMLVVEDEFVLENELVDPATKHAIQQWARTAVADDQAQRVRIDWLYREEGQGKVETAVSVDYYYTYPHELDLMLQQAGFQLQALWGNYSQAPFTQQSERLLVLAQAP